MEGTVLLCGPAPPTPPRQHLLPKSLHHTQTVTPQERKTQEVGMESTASTGESGPAPLPESRWVSRPLPSCSPQARRRHQPLITWTADTRWIGRVSDCRLAPQNVRGEVLEVLGPSHCLLEFTVTELKSGPVCGAPEDSQDRP